MWARVSRPTSLHPSNFINESAASLSAGVKLNSVMSPTIMRSCLSNSFARPYETHLPPRLAAFYVFFKYLQHIVSFFGIFIIAYSCNFFKALNFFVKSDPINHPNTYKKIR
jgi:hypothetical protein